MSEDKKRTSLVPRRLFLIDLREIPREELGELMKFQDERKLDMKDFIRHAGGSLGFAGMSVGIFFYLLGLTSMPVLAGMLSALMIMSFASSVFNGSLAASAFLRLAKSRFRSILNDEEKFLAMDEQEVLLLATAWNAATEKLNDSMDALSSFEDQIRELPNGRFRDKRLKQYAKEAKRVSDAREEFERFRVSIEKRTQDIRQKVLSQSESTLLLRDCNDEADDPEG